MSLAEGEVLVIFQHAEGDGELEAGRDREGDHRRRRDSARSRSRCQSTRAPRASQLRLDGDRIQRVEVEVRVALEPDELLMHLAELAADWNLVTEDVAQHGGDVPTLVVQLLDARAQSS